MATILWLAAAVFAQLMVIVYPGVLVFWLIFHNNIDRLRNWGIHAYWVAAFAWAITSGPLLLFRRDMFSLRWIMPQPISGIAIGVGAVALVSAVALLAQAGRQISLRTLVGFPEIEPAKNKQPVLQSGIYSRTRNPIYLAHWLLVLASAALTSFAANWIMLALDCIVLPMLIRAEERELLARYDGEFAQYMRRVPRFFPQLR